MDIHKILHIGSDCYESNPCQHKCRCETKDCRLFETLIYAPKLIQHVELMDDNLLEHFSQYDESLLRLIKQDTYDIEFAKECKELYYKHYHGKRDEIFNEFMNKLKQLDIKKNMLDCLRAGYAGFIVYEDPFIGVFSREQRTTVCKLIDQKVFNEHLKNIVKPQLSDNSLVIYIDNEKLGLLEGEHIILHQLQEEK